MWSTLTLLAQRLYGLLETVEWLLEQVGAHRLWSDKYGFALSLTSLCWIALILWIKKRLDRRHYRVCSGKQWVTLLDLAKTAYHPEHKMRVLSVIEGGPIDVNGYRDASTGLTLFLSACLSGQMDLVTTLMDKGADYKALTLHQDSALLLATYGCSTVKGADPRLVDLLACRGVDVNKRDDHGNSALSIAALFGRADIISMLLEYGADRLVSEASSVSPLDLAGYSGNLTAAKLLEVGC